MTDPEVTLVGRSSSHFTRTARIFALELGVQHAFRPVLDMTTPDPAAYADNPALKVPHPAGRAGAAVRDGEHLPRAHRAARASGIAWCSGATWPTGWSPTPRR